MIGIWRASEVGHVWFLPFPGFIIISCGRILDAMVDPAMPAGRNYRAFGIAVIDHPTVFRNGVGDRRRRAIVAIAKFILTDELALSPSIESQTQRLATPPREELLEKFEHYAAFRRTRVRRGRLWLNGRAPSSTW